MSDTYQDQAHQNGYAPIDITHQPIRVRFGPGETQTMPLDWAEHILTALAQNHVLFGKMLTAAALAAR